MKADYSNGKNYPHTKRGRGWRYWLAELNTHLNNQADVITIPLPPLATVPLPRSASTTLGLAARYETRRRAVKRRATYVRQIGYTGV